MPTDCRSDVQDQLDQNGYVILKNVLEPNVVAAVKSAMTRYTNEVASELLSEGKVDQTFENEPFETRLLRLFENCRECAPGGLKESLHVPEMFGIFFHPRLLDLVETLLGSEIRLYPNYYVRPKLPEHDKTQVPWHQDAYFTAAGLHGSDPDAGDLTADKLRMVNVWSPLVPARPENGCMKFIPGTHKLGVVPHCDAGIFSEVEETYLKPRLKDAVDIILDPGDVVLFSNLLFHTGQPNVTNTVRWSCDWRYQDANQSTMRDQRGHIARSRISPESVVRDAAHWATLSFS